VQHLHERDNPPQNPKAGNLETIPVLSDFATADPRRLGIFSSRDAPLSSG
jgi:hypothetical protein